MNAEAKPLGRTPWIYLSVAVALLVAALTLGGDDHRNVHRVLFAACAAWLVAALPCKTDRGQRLQRIATVLTMPVILVVFGVLG